MEIWIEVCPEGGTNKNSTEVNLESNNLDSIQEGIIALRDWQKRTHYNMYKYVIKVEVFW